MSIDFHILCIESAIAGEPQPGHLPILEDQKPQLGNLICNTDGDRDVTKRELDQVKQLGLRQPERWRSQMDSSRMPQRARILLTAGRMAGVERNQGAIVMRTKFLRCWQVLAAFGTVLTYGSGTAQAATCTVPGTYPSIQAAVNDATCSTINVLPGAYVENVIINRSLTLNGAQAGNPVAGRTSGSAAESTVYGANPIGANPVITIKATNVTVDGFTLRNPITTGAAVGVDVKTPGTGDVITNNFIDTITTADTGVNGTAQAIYLENGPDNVQILGNDMKDVQSARSAKGITIGDGSSTDPSTNILIDGNSISNITSLSRGAYGISVNNGNGSTMNSGLKIQNNSINNLNGGTGWVHAIGLEANTPGVLVRDNSISNLIPAPGGTIAVWFESEDTSFASGHVNENNLDVTIAAYGIAVDPSFTSGTVDGTCNWWGDPNGPGPIGPAAGAKVSPRVTYMPWLTAPNPVGACIGGASTPGKVTGGGQIDGDPVFSPLGDLLSLPAVVPSLASPTSPATFGFVATCCAPSGNLEYNDHAADVRIKAQSIDGLSISAPGMSCPATPGSRHATFTGTAAVIRSAGTTTEPFTVDVDDCGEPGTADSFGIKTTTYSNGPSTLTGGNIQIH
jgi:hypothetical protein